MTVSRAEQVQQALAALQVALPATYVRHLEVLAEPTAIRVGSDGPCFWLLPAEHLIEPYELNGWQGVPFAHAIRQYIRMHELGPHGIADLVGGEAMTFETLNNCISIGDGLDGGALLMIEPASGVVYGYIDELSQLQRYAPTFQRFLASCTPY